MTREVKKLSPIESVHTLCELLLHTHHGGFPVCVPPAAGTQDESVYFGLVNR